VSHAAEEEDEKGKEGETAVPTPPTSSSRVFCGAANSSSDSTTDRVPCSFRTRGTVDAVAALHSTAEELGQDPAIALWDSPSPISLITNSGEVQRWDEIHRGTPDTTASPTGIQALLRRIAAPHADRSIDDESRLSKTTTTIPTTHNAQRGGERNNRRMFTNEEKKFGGKPLTTL